MSVDLRIFLSLISLVVPSLMLWDQLRCDGMTPFKWALMPVLYVLCVLPIWT
jgi:hypothetical protein